MISHSLDHLDLNKKKKEKSLGTGEIVGTDGVVLPPAPDRNLKCQTVQDAEAEKFINEAIIGFTADDMGRSER